MNEMILQVNYLMNGILHTLPTKMAYERSERSELKNIHYEVIFGNKNIISYASDDTEFAVVNLQKSLPVNVSVACCQSCIYGNFCPFGDSDDEIFCLKEVVVYNKNDVCEFFSLRYNLITNSRKLLDFCNDYQPIGKNDYYTYNDWAYNLKK